MKSSARSVELLLVEAALLVQKRPLALQARRGRFCVEHKADEADLLRELDSHAQGSESAHNQLLVLVPAHSELLERVPRWAAGPQYHQLFHGAGWRWREIEGSLCFCRWNEPQCRSVAHTTVPIAVGMPTSTPALARVRGHQIVSLRVGAAYGKMAFFIQDAGIARAWEEESQRAHAKSHQTRSTDLGNKSLR